MEEESVDASIIPQNILDSIKNYLENDFNTPLALSEFMKFVSVLNEYATKEIISTKISNLVLPIFKKIMYIFGLRIAELRTVEIEKVNEMIVLRNEFRKNKEFEKSDNIRITLKENYGIELIDHKNYRTIWKKVEN
jgi:cysteinyl-tRNA synthetase